MLIPHERQLPPPNAGAMDTTLRPAMPADTEAVGRMLARSYRALLADGYEPALLREALPLISVARPGLISCGTYYLIEQEDRVLAAGGWTDVSPHGAPGRAGVGHLRHLATDPLVARCGYGSRLFGQVIQSARAAGITDLRCQSTLTAVPFHAAHGFTVVGEIDVRLPTGVLFPAVQMRWLDDGD